MPVGRASGPPEPGSGTYAPDAGHPPLADALSAMLPGGELTLFLRCCVQGEESCHDAWHELCRRVDPARFLRTKGRSVVHHLPLLYTNLKANGVSIPTALRPYLSASVVHERLRFAQYDSCLREVSDRLGKAGVDFTLLKGAALALTVYESPTLRHCHDIDILVDRADLPEADDALASRGFRIDRTTETAARVIHDSGLPVNIHSTLLSNPVYTVPAKAIIDRRREIAHQNVLLKILSPSDMLVHVCAQASTASRRPNCNWVVDSHAVLRRYAGLDWYMIHELITESGLALPLYVMLRYLNSELGAPVPSRALDRLRREASVSDSPRLAAAIDGVRRGRPGGLGLALRKSCWSSRLRLLRYSWDCLWERVTETSTASRPGSPRRTGPSRAGPG